MVDLPHAMRKDGRDSDEVFQPEEYLYRRVPLTLWGDKSDPIEPDAIELPDMSVVRSKYAHPEWTRFNEHGDYVFEEWGVVGFLVSDLVAMELMHAGQFRWTFKPVHKPIKWVYPHAEVHAFEDGEYVNAKDKLEPDVHLRWREQLARKLNKFLGPRETVTVRQTAP